MTPPALSWPKRGVRIHLLGDELHRGDQLLVVDVVLGAECPLMRIPGFERLCGLSRMAHMDILAAGQSHGVRQSPTLAEPMDTVLRRHL